MPRDAYPAGSLLPWLRRSLLERPLFSPDELVVLAVSGGPDSLCLLHCLAALRSDLGIRLHVAHVHHGLRGADADADAAFVIDRAAASGLPSSLLRLDTRALRRGSVQAAARRERYAALRSLVASLGGGCVATAHTEDDQAETVLLHLLRGSGLDGLAAMRPRAGDLVRPLLWVSRRVIEDHCRAHSLEPRFDASNLNRAYRRNALRLDLLPAIEQQFPAARHTLARAAAALARDADYLHERSSEALRAIVRERAPGMLVIDLGLFRGLHPALRLHALRAALDELGGRVDWTLQHLETVETLAAGCGAGWRKSLPRGLRAEASGDRLMLSTRSPAPLPPPVCLPVPGEVVYGDWVLGAVVEDVPAHGGAQVGAEHVVWCDAEAAGARLEVRGRRAGDRLRPLGMEGTKKLQDLLVDRKLPRSERDSLPIVAGPRGILWVVGHALGHDVRLTAASTAALRLSARPLSRRSADPAVDAHDASA